MTVATDRMQIGIAMRNMFRVVIADDGSFIFSNRHTETKKNKRITWKTMHAFSGISNNPCGKCSVCCHSAHSEKGKHIPTLMVGVLFFEFCSVCHEKLCYFFAVFDTIQHSVFSRQNRVQLAFHNVWIRIRCCEFRLNFSKWKM